MSDKNESGTPKVAVAPTVPAVPPTPAAVQPVAPKPEVKGSTDKLFPDMVEQPAKTVVAPPTDEVVSVEALKGKKFKIGEEVLPIEDVMRRIQSVSQLTQKAAELSALEHQLNEKDKGLRKQMETAAAIIPTLPTQAPLTNGYEDLLKESILADDPVFKKVLDDLVNIKMENQELKRLTSKSKYDESLNVLDQRARQKGHEDFREYIPKIEEEFKKLPDSQKAAADNFDWWLGTFYDMKLQKNSAEIKALKEKQQPPARVEGSPMEGIAASEGGSVTKPIDLQWQTSYNEAFEKAKKSGRTEDWAEVLRLKGEAPV